jgi:hypothetical protein
MLIENGQVVELPEEPSGEDVEIDRSEPWTVP